MIKQSKKATQSSRDRNGTKESRVICHSNELGTDRKIGGALTSPPPCHPTTRTDLPNGPQIPYVAPPAYCNSIDISASTQSPSDPAAPPDDDSPNSPEIAIEVIPGISRRSRNGLYCCVIGEIVQNGRSQIFSSDSFFAQNVHEAWVRGFLSCLKVFARRADVLVVGVPDNIAEIFDGLSKWERNGWRRHDGGRPAALDVWQEIYELSRSDYHSVSADPTLLTRSANANLIKTIKRQATRNVEGRGMRASRRARR